MVSTFLDIYKVILKGKTPETFTVSGEARASVSGKSFL